MADVYKGLTIRLGADTSKLSDALRKSRSEASATTKSLKEIARELKFNPGNTILLAQQQKAYQQQVDTTKAKLESLKAAESQIGKEKMNTEQWDKLQRDIIATEGQLNSYKRKLAEVNITQAANESALGRAANKIEQFGLKHESAGRRMSSVGTALSLSLTPAIVAASAAAVKMSFDFENAMAKVSTIADTTEVPMDILRESIVKLSDDTGIASTDIAENVYNAISAGQKTGDAVAFVENATKLAKAGFTDSASALDVLTSSMNAYGFESDEVGRVSDVLLMTQNKGKTTVGELSAQMGKAIPTASAFGVNLENLAAAYATTTAKGIATAESTTYINGMLNELGDSGSNVGGIIKEKLGMSFTDAMASGVSLGDALSVVQQHADDTGVTMFDLFGSAEAAKAAFAIAGEGSDGFASNLDAMNNSAGATDDAFQKMQTKSELVKISANQLKNMLIELGDTLVGELSPSIDGATKFVKDFTEWFDSLDDSGKQAVITVAGIAAAAAPALMVGGKLVSSASAIAGGMRSVARLLPSVQAKAERAGIAQAELAVSTTTAGTSASIASKQQGVLATQTAKTETATKRHTIATKASAAAMGAAKVAAIGAAIAFAGVLVAFAVGEWDKAQKRQENLKKSTEGLRDATNAFGDSYRTASGDIGTAASSMDNYTLSVDDVLQKQAELSDKIAETWSSIGSDTSLVDGYMRTIETLQGKSELTKDEQDKLAVAVAGVNEVCGTSIEIVDGVTGKLSESTDGINDNTEAWKANIKIQAAQEELIELEKQMNDNIEAKNAAQERYNDVQKEYDEAVAAGIPGTLQYSAAVERAKTELNDASAAIDGTASAQAKHSDIIAESTSKVRISADAVSAYMQSNVDLSNTLGDLDVAAFSQAIADIGISQEQIAKMTPQQLQQIIGAWDGSVESIKPALDSYKANVGYALDQSTKDSILKMGQNINEGIAPTSAEIELLRQAIETPIEGTKLATDQDTKLAVAGIVSNLQAGVPLTAEQAELLRGSLAKSTAGVEYQYGSDISAAMTAMNSGLLGGTPLVSGSASGVKAAADAGVSGMPSSFGATSDSAVSAFNRPLYGAAGTKDAAVNLPKKANEGASSIDGSGAANNFSGGFVGGIGNWLGRSLNAGFALARNAVDGLNRGQDARSPSRKTGESADWFAQGWTKRLDANKSKSFKAGYNYVSASLDGANKATRSFGAVTQRSLDGLRVSTPSLSSMRSVNPSIARTSTATKQTAVNITIHATVREEADARKISRQIVKDLKLVS